MLLLFNTKGPTGLGINTSRSATDVWNSYLQIYGTVSSIAQLTTEQELRNINYNEKKDFPTYIALLWEKLSYARSLGAEITEKNFVAIVLNSLPPSWNSIVTTIFKNHSSSDVIAEL